MLYYCSRDTHTQWHPHTHEKRISYWPIYIYIYIHTRARVNYNHSQYSLIIARYLGSRYRKTADDDRPRIWRGYTVHVDIHNDTVTHHHVSHFCPISRLLIANHFLAAKMLIYALFTSAFVYCLFISCHWLHSWSGRYPPNIAHHFRNKLLYVMRHYRQYTEKSKNNNYNMDLCILVPGFIDCVTHRALLIDY